MSEIPFYPNKKTDTHCVQAALRIVLKYFLPDKHFSFAELDTITGHEPHLWTYPYKMYLWLAQNGFEVLHTEQFPVDTFAAEGVKFLKRFWEPSVYAIQKQYSDFSAARRDAQKALRHPSVTFQNRRGTLARAIEQLKKGYMVLIRVNPYTLRSEEGSGSHIVVVTHVTARHIWLHDPGLPPQKNRRVTHTRMKKAMYGDDTLVIAIRKKTP